MATMKHGLIRPSLFQSRNRDVFRTLAALRRRLDMRRENGLISSGAVIESPVGLLIDEAKFVDWLTGQNGNPDANSSDELEIAA